MTDATPSRDYDQFRAADPRESVWVMASAGSGKTKVLTDRVLNLLLDGAAPEGLLALTFTRAAAAEMRGRVMGELAAFATLPDADLRARLALIRDDLSPAAMGRARGLFHRLLDSPDPLKIMTIHGFCQGLLTQFPLEAGITPGFAVADERLSDALLDRALALALADADAGGALVLLTDRMEPETLRGVIRRAYAAAASLDPQAIRASLRLRFASPQAAEADFRARFAPAIRAWPEPEARDWLAGGATIEVLKPLFLTQKGTPRVRLPDHLKPMLDEALAAFEACDGARLVELNAALKSLLAPVAARYAQLKAAAGVLDYDDLIDKTRDLLTRADERDWLRYKLDYKLEHVLVDEAQDTSPRQWEIVQALVEDFTAFAGNGAEERGARTLFVVGDAKQSIFSFQGADLAAFSATRAHLAAQANGRLAEVPLVKSYRSAQGILDLVNAVLGRPEFAAMKLSADDKRHAASRQGTPYHIVLWAPPAPAARAADEPDMADRMASRWEPAGDMAARTVEQVKALLAEGYAPADIMILLRSRGTFAPRIIRALKLAGVPVNGLDRLDVLAHPAALDVMAVLRFIACPPDDLALAEVLKGPYIGMDDEALLNLSHARKGSLWQAVNASEPETAERLKAVLAMSHLRPYELISLLLAGGLRQAIAGALGDDSQEVLDELLALAMAFETDEHPTLQNFINRTQGRAALVKRDAEGAGVPVVRLMTVHAAKGLQAPAVILPDAGAWRPPTAHAKEKPCRLAGRPDLWLPDASGGADYIEAFKEREYQEYLRLLYVALTRAKERLYIGSRKAPAAGSWYAIVASAMTAMDAREEENGDLALGQGFPVPAREAAVGGAPDDGGAPIPTSAAPPESAESGGAEAPSHAPRTGDAEALARGRTLHRLLELLPEGADPAAITDDEALIARARAALADPQTAAFFGKNSVAEAEIAGPMGLRRVDRLALTDAEVLVLDWKTGSSSPASIAANRRQMEEYKEILRDLFPERTPRAYLFFAGDGKLVEV
ncbi:double-strand break repair helicase AddA [Alphaproteobacteria bacterium]|nr:double-strand break repair helicase AddA [Alphaproteobacteria bacterium]